MAATDLLELGADAHPVPRCTRRTRTDTGAEAHTDAGAKDCSPMRGTTATSRCSTFSG